MPRRRPDTVNWGGPREGAGRKIRDGEKKKTVAVSIAADLLGAAKAIATAREISFSSLVEETLRKLVEQESQV